MTVVQWGLAMLRQWRLLALGMLMTLAVAALATHARTVYWTDSTVRLAGPNPNAVGIDRNSLVSTTESVIAMAGLIALEANGGPAGPRFSSDSVSIVDAGLTSGRLIRLPNAGGQWATNFNQPSLNVQVAGSDPEQVRAETEATHNELARLLNSRQDALGVPPESRIVMLANPQETAIRTAQGSRSRSVVAVLAVGAGMTVAAAMYLDFWRLRQHGGRHATSNGTRRRHNGKETSYA